MSGFMPVNPRPMLLSLVGKEIRVRLKWGYTEYTGALISADSYMNLQLANTEEFIDGKSTGSLGQVLIRCNNVLWIAAKDAAVPGKSNDTEMSGSMFTVKQLEAPAGLPMIKAAPSTADGSRSKDIEKDNDEEKEGLKVAMDRAARDPRRSGGRP